MTLKKGLGKKLKEWSSILDTENMYVNQSITAILTDQDGKSHPSTASNIDQFLEQCPSNARVVVYAEAGMGKSTVLCHIARSWLDGNPRLAERFAYVFLIPLRLVRGHILIDVICQDLGLLPQDYRDTLGRILKTPNRVLFLLDSYEELSYDIDDINRLIRRDAHSGKSVMVVVTSRPGSGLGKVIGSLNDYSTVDLKDFTDKEIERYIKTYPAEANEKERFVSIAENFDKDFLKRPINLSLVCYLCKTRHFGNTGVRGQRLSQTKLFNEIVKHILNVYLRKKKFRVDRELDALTLLGSKDRKLDLAKPMLRDICRMCYQARRRNDQLLQPQNREDFIEFGLFVPGNDETSVAVPHLLIMEFFAAVHLVGNKEAWTELFEEVDEKCGKGEPRHSLEDVVRKLGLENVIKFVVGLSPDVAQELHSMFVIKRRKTTGISLSDFIYFTGSFELCYCYQSDYSYQLQLLQESEVKSAMAEALCNAPVITDFKSDDYVKNSGADQLLDVFTVEQSHQFLAKAYGCETKSNSVRGVTMCRTNTVPHEDFLCDSYVVRYLQKFRCTALKMGEVMVVRDSDISLDLLTQLTSAVSEKLSIRDCRLLCAEDGQHIYRLLQTMPAPTLRQIEMELNNSELCVDVLRLLISAVSEKLSIHCCRLLCAESSEHIYRQLQTMPAPTPRQIEMELINSELCVDVLRLLISAVSEKLSIHYCRLLYAESSEHIYRLLQTMPAPTLRQIEVKLNNSELSVDVLRLLISAVSERLSIHYCRLLCAESSEHVYRLLQTMPAPTPRQIEVKLNNSELSVDVLRLLISTVSERLSIHYCRLLCAESGEHIYRLLQTMPAPTLRQIEVKLNNSELSVDVLRLLISAVSEELSIWGCRSQCAESAEHFQRLLQPMPAPAPRQIKMELKESELSLDILRLLISAVNEKLSIDNCRSPCEESSEHIYRLLQTMPLSTLRETIIIDSELSVNVLRLLISPVSEKLSIRKCKLPYAESGEHINRLLQLMPAPTLRQIFIESSQLSVDLLRLLISAVSEKLSIVGGRLLCAESGEHIQRLLQLKPASTLREISKDESELSVNILRLVPLAVSKKLSIWEIDCCVERGGSTSKNC